MKKLCIFSVIFYVILFNVFQLQARDEHQPQVCFSAWPTQHSNVGPHVQAYSQINQVSNDSYNFNTPQNSLFSSTSRGQDWYQQHRQFVLSNVVGISLQGKTIKITPEDVNLINHICADNPHKSPDALRMQLSQSSAFNYAQHFLKGDNLLHAFTSDIFIDPAHFKSVSESKHRIAKLEKAARDAIEKRHKREKSQLESTYKEQLKVAKKKSKSEENRVASAHKKELADLEAQHKKEKKYPLGIKQPKKPITALQSQVTPLVEKSNISSQEIQRLREHNNSQVSKVNSAQDSSFQQVMNERSQAFESSINNPVLTTKHIKFNSQTAGFLQVHGIDTAQFQQIEGLPIQHQLIHELVDVLDAVADYAQQHHYEMYQTHLTKYCAHLASLSQQSNVEGALEQAIDGTNCCHGIEHYLTGMVSSIGQAYQQFQTALDYFDAVVDTYGNLIVQHAAQGALVAHGLEAIVTAGMIAAPTATIAATGIMIGATAYVMAPVCAQAMIDTMAFGGACITGDWDKVARDLDNFGTFISSRETVARMAEFAGGAAMPTPNLSSVVEHVLSLRPVITSVQNEAGQAISKLYVMSKDQIQKTYQQAVEFVQLPEFINFNVMYEKILGCHFFDILPQSHPALAGAFSGLESGAISLSEQATLTSLFTQSESSAVGQVIQNEVTQTINSIYPVVESIEQTIVSVQNTVWQEIQQALQQSYQNVTSDLYTPINLSRAVELADLSQNIRQLQDLAKYTNNFQNLNELIPEDIVYLNRIYELQSYRTQIKNFLDTHKPYFVYEGQKYSIEDIASYHIHAGDYFIKDNPGGAHSNYQGQKLTSFNPQLIKNGSLGTTDVMLYNARLQNRKKPSSIYPESWSEFVCDLKAIEIMMSGNAEIRLNKNGTSFVITGTTSDGLEIIVHYDIQAKRIKTHHPNIH